MSSPSVVARQFASVALVRLRPTNGAGPALAASAGEAAVICPPLPDPATDERDDRPPFVVGLVMVAPFVPCVAAAATTLAYVLRLGDGPAWWGTWQDNLAAIGIGLAVALGSWVLVGWRCTPFGAPDRANPGSHALLRTRLGQLQARCAVFCAPGRAVPGVDPEAACAACREAEAHCRAVADDLRRTGLQWVMATGYDAQWRRLNRAEEALLEVEPRASLANEALYDHQRLQGSGLRDLERLGSHMSWALRELDLVECVGSAATVSATAPVLANGAGGKPGRSRRAPEARLRAVLREIRYAINDFRERQTTGLIQARNRLLKTVLVTSIGSYLLLGLAVAADAPRGTVAAVAAAFLVGGLVGLFNRMRVESRMDCAVEDYGLSVARLIHTPLFSGLAAVAGVFLTAVLAAAVSDAVGQAASTPPGATESLPKITQVFNLETNPFALVVAAVFGLTPDLVINRLRDQTEQMTNNLRKTQPVTATAEKETVA